MGDNVTKLYQFPSQLAAGNAYRTGAVVAPSRGNSQHGIIMLKETIDQCFMSQSGKPRPLYDDNGNPIQAGQPAAAAPAEPKPRARMPSKRAPRRSRVGLSNSARPQKGGNR